MSGDFLNNILLAIFGYGTGIFVGTVSGTAEALMIPCLTIFLGYSMHNSIGTSLTIDCIIGGVAGLIFLKNNNVDVKSSALLISISVIFAFIGSQFTTYAPETGLTIVIGFILILIGINFIANGVQKNIDYIHSKINFKIFRKNKNVSFILMGIIVGLFSGFLGMGSGGIVATVLVLVLGYDLHSAIGTSLVTMFFIAGAGALGHAINQEIIIHVIPIAGITAAAGAISGSFLANKIDEKELGKLIGVIVLILGIFITTKIFL
ncbi:MAG: sulfite exporter TauE/SafE family protein [Candidatus Thermoplasmatota archaeon]